MIIQMKKNNKSGVSLVEMVVILAVIVFVLLVVLPATSYSRARSAGMVCMANVQSLARSWNAYQEDFDGWIVTGFNYYVNYGSSTPMFWRWVEPPLLDSSPEVFPAGSSPYNWLASGDDRTLEARLRGIRAGRLYPYVGDERIYHCPSDKRYITARTISDKRYRTYSIPGMMAGEEYSREGQYIGAPVNKKKRVAYKMSEIQAPSEKYIFVEENVNQDYNRGSWVLFDDDNPWSWRDPLAVFHNNRGTLSFADGHAELINRPTIATKVRSA